MSVNFLDYEGLTPYTLRKQLHVIFLWSLKTYNLLHNCKPPLQTPPLLEIFNFNSLRIICLYFFGIFGDFWCVQLPSACLAWYGQFLNAALVVEHVSTCSETKELSCDSISNNATTNWCQNWFRLHVTCLPNCCTTDRDRGVGEVVGGGWRGLTGSWECAT